ncbi:SEL1-like repeat protein [Fodinicurvata halophila]|uniref:SEL1-like repeat protein n=1 Tax=Fodinicurvata halophila TaxID=1419723 RepID=UPI00362630E8
MAESQFALAEMYRLGVSVDENPGRALYWYERALEQGHERAEAEAEKLQTAGIASDAPDELPQSVEPSLTEPAEVAEPEAPVEETDASPAAPEETEAVEDEAREVDDSTAESETAEAEDSRDTLGGDQASAPQGETSARDLFPLDSALQEDPEQTRDVKKNGDSGVKREKDPTGAVELYPERMNRLARSRAESAAAAKEAEKADEADEAEARDAEENGVASEEQAAAGSISGDALSEMKADPLYEGAGEAAAEDESEEADAREPEQDAGEVQEGSQEMASAETETDTPDNDQNTDQAASRDGDFALWLGSMRTEDGARRLWNEARARHEAQLDGLSYDTREIETDDGVFLRVLAVGYETRAAGQESCEAITATDSEAFCRVVTRQ